PKRHGAWVFFSSGQFAVREIRDSLDDSRSRLWPAAGITCDAGPRVRSDNVDLIGEEAFDLRCVVARIDPRIRSHTRTPLPLSGPRLAQFPAFVATADGGFCQAWPLLRIPQQRINSFRASATIAFFFDTPLATSRFQVANAQRL